MSKFIANRAELLALWFFQGNRNDVVKECKELAQKDPAAGVALTLRTYSYLMSHDERTVFMRMMTDGLQLP